MAKQLDFEVRLLETPAEMLAAEELQAHVWSGTRIVPAHLLVSIQASGGIILGAYSIERLIGFAFSFPGIAEQTGQLKQMSHMLAVDPEFREAGVGFSLKRAQWQMARRQGIELITWTYDPLISRNAFLNLVKLGAISQIYIRDYYGELADELNQGLASDRFQVDWWLNSDRVNTRLGKQARGPLALQDVYSGGAKLLNESHLNKQALPVPAESFEEIEPDLATRPNLLLVEIPADFLALKEADLALANAWRNHTRDVFESLFALGYIASDFIHMRNEHARSFYLLSDGTATLGE